MSGVEHVTVIGAGVSGLTSAVVLAESGVRVHVIAAEWPGGNSLAAGAMWGPYLVEPRDKVAEWSRHSLEVFRTLAGDPCTGVRITSGVEASRHAVAPPDWATTRPGFRPCAPNELPPGFRTGYRFEVPLIDMPSYLGSLHRRLLAIGATVAKGRVTDLDDPDLGPVVVNCSGLGSRQLADDTDLRPIRGQHVVVANPGITEFFSEDTGTSTDLLCVYPHGDTVVLGGTAIDGREDLSPDPEAAEAILRRCTTVEPRLAEARVLAHRIGARPTRPAVRVEAEVRANGRTVIHNYGHGGAGVTLSWGCARDVHLLSAGRSQAY
ncbi:D-amino-acid:oxygen oxidoreductase [Streptomyces sp. DvalAA-14]|uniref:FAD-dependent oxidoreductase n=1 Tax=unclassified Streptomyces TaxID=2593676 RepID=UPI00081B2F08|nr:FAD-dependent oxidoreductase [Streptomyces sp. DvalAA-14]MYS24702.1 FAD-dependent oxidoreductase [Streptomyces sp. SID4948]SCE48553.1 D-amino-acid:oxygen oxidoreductase [Streptomyces sp. DvalAA-14]